MPDRGNGGDVGEMQPQGSFTETIFQFTIPYWIAIPVGIAILVLIVFLIRRKR